MTQGVYEIRNINTGKFYIGSSINIENRWKSHIRDLNNNQHHSTKLQRSWNKYQNPIDNFIFNILYEYLGNERLELYKLEQDWIDKIEPYKNNIGYNISSLAIYPETKLQVKKKLIQNLKDDIQNVMDEFKNWANLQNNKELNIKINIREKEFTKQVYKIQKIFLDKYKSYYNFVKNNVLPIYQYYLTSNIDVVGEIIHYLNDLHGIHLYTIARLNNNKYLWHKISVGEFHILSKNNNLDDDNSLLGLCLNNKGIIADTQLFKTTDECFKSFGDEYLLNKIIKENS